MRKMISASVALLFAALPAAAFAQYYATYSYPTYTYPSYSYPQYYSAPIQGAYIYQPTYLMNYQPYPYAAPQQQRQSQPQYSYPSYASQSYGNYGGYVPSISAGPQQGYPTGDSVWGNQLCYYPGYGRAYCGSDPRQPVYDPWTGTWY